MDNQDTIAYRHIYVPIFCIFLHARNTQFYHKISYIYRVYTIRQLIEMTLENRR